MNNTDLAKALKGNRLYGGSYPCDKIPKPPGRPIAFIINTDKAGLPGTHWIALLIDEKEGSEYFDSFGLPPYEPSIIAYIKRYCKYITYNNQHIQNKTATTCGLYCVKYIVARSKGIGMNMFIHMFSMKRPENEQLLWHL